MFTAQPIGFFKASEKEKYAVPFQPSVVHQNEGVITLKPHCQFEQALEGLERFDRIWVVFWFHQNHHWKPKVRPPRGGIKQGVFATRSPHRPNFIGLSCVQLKAIKGLKLFISHHDLIDGTPILDLKPYINYADAVPASKQGWLEDLQEPQQQFEVEWSVKAQAQASYLKQWEIDLENPVNLRLCSNPFPYPNHRIKHLNGFMYELGYKSWRVVYEVNNQHVHILNLKSGYDFLTLQGNKQSKWSDVPIHQAFIQIFNE